MAYLIAPPLEAAVGLDAALKAADVKLKTYLRPPDRDKLCRGTALRKPGRLPGRLRGICGVGAPGGGDASCILTERT